MDEWDKGYADGFREAVMTVQELAADHPEIKVTDVIHELEAERRTLLTPKTCRVWNGPLGPS